MLKSAQIAAIVGVACCSLRAHADDIQANPASYASLLASLKPGDILHLAGGDYPHVSFANLNGTSSA